MFTEGFPTIYLVHELREILAYNCILMSENPPEV